MTWSTMDEKLFAAALAAAPRCGPAQMNRLAGLVGLTPVNDDVMPIGEFVDTPALSA